MATSFRSKVAEIGDLPLFISLAFRHGLQCHNFDFKKLNGNNFSALCRNLVRFGPVKPDITMLEVIIFATMQQK